MATQQEVANKLKTLNNQYGVLFGEYRAAQNINNPPERASAAKKVTIGAQGLLTDLSKLNADAAAVAKTTGSQVQLSEVQALIRSTGTLITDSSALERSSANLPATTTGTAAGATTQERPRVDTRTSSGRSGDSVSRTSLQVSATQTDAAQAALNTDWRVRLSLAPFSGPILYRMPDSDVGILGPLKQTDGVIFPYTPNIQMNYAAKYEDVQLLQTNYKLFQYTGSGIENVTIQCDFTAQDTFEANYLLAAIHFFRSLTKMFYGQDSNPKNGTPPPLCYLYGLGEFQFNGHPLAVHTFTYNLPNNVHYIRASNTTIVPGVSRDTAQFKGESMSRMNSLGAGIAPGGVYQEPQFPNYYPDERVPTYVPTAMNISIQCYPIISRNLISNKYSTRDYASGNLLLGSRNIGNGGGFW